MAPEKLLQRLKTEERELSMILGRIPGKASHHLKSGSAEHGKNIANNRNFRQKRGVLRLIVDWNSEFREAFIRSRCFSWLPFTFTFPQSDSFC